MQLRRRRLTCRFAWLAVLQNDALLRLCRRVSRHSKLHTLSAFAWLTPAAHSSQLEHPPLLAHPRHSQLHGHRALRVAAPGQRHLLPAAQREHHVRERHDDDGVDAHDVPAGRDARPELDDPARRVWRHPARDGNGRLDALLRSGARARRICGCGTGGRAGEGRGDYRADPWACTRVCRVQRCGDGEEETLECSVE